MFADAATFTSFEAHNAVMIDRDCFVPVQRNCSIKNSCCTGDGLSLAYFAKRASSAGAYFAGPPFIVTAWPSMKSFVRTSASLRPSEATCLHSASTSAKAGELSNGRTFSTVASCWAVFPNWTAVSCAVLIKQHAIVKTNDMIIFFILNPLLQLNGPGCTKGLLNESIHPRVIGTD